ncbi:RNA-binding motif protein, X-linked 2, partial [Lecanoromycetidae sp. Uapishka_2]
MNAIREIQNLNKRELEAGVSTEASWHADYRDTAYIFIGGLPFDLSEGDIFTIFSQFGEPTYLNLVRDKESGKSKGFAFLKYEDQRSTDLAVDNLGGASVMGKLLKVDHTRYKRKDGEEEEERERNMKGGIMISDAEESAEEQRPMLQEELELQRLLREHDEDDPMKEYLVQEKKEEVTRAVARLEKSGKEIRDGGGERKHKHHHRRHHDRDGEKRRHRDPGSEDERRRRHRHKHRRRSRSP